MMEKAPLTADEARGITLIALANLPETMAMVNDSIRRAAERGERSLMYCLNESETQFTDGIAHDLCKRGFNVGIGNTRNIGISW